MNKDFLEIDDNEIRVLGPSEPKPEPPKPKGRWWLWILAFLLAVALYVFWSQNRPMHSQSTYSEEPLADTTEIVTYKAQTETKAFTQVSQETVNDIALQIYSPNGGHVELLVGQLPSDDKSIILAAQAADYRADNGQISGAFVYKGELLSRGHPKYGFCAIIGDQLTMGMSQETALFERAVEQEGYFFRQFSLVHDGKPGETLPKGKAIRREIGRAHV